MLSLWQTALHDPRFHIGSGFRTLSEPGGLPVEAHADLTRAGRVVQNRSIFDPSLLADVKQAFGESPWIMAMPRLERAFPGHLAFEVENTDMLLAMRDYLKENDIPIVFEGRKGPGSNISLHFMDPDAYEFELYCNLDQIDATGRARPSEQWNRVQSLEAAIENPVPETW